MKRTLLFLLAVLFASLLAAACGAPAASDYNQKCTTANDCVAVYDRCDGSCACANAAISASALNAFEADHTSCHDRPCPCPPGPDVACTAGKCEL